MRNFKKETVSAIKESGHDKSDVMFIGSNDGKYRISIEKFEDISDFNYEGGFGAAYIPTDLIIYFKDQTYISRGEYDGSEWWEFNRPLKYSGEDAYESFDKIPLNMWRSLEEGLKSDTDE